MGCHTWFARPVTPKEFSLMQEYCMQEAENFFGDNPENRKAGYVDLYRFNLIKKSFRENIPCIEGAYWYQLGWGAGNPELPDRFYVSWMDGRLFVDCSEFHETARVSLGIYTYPHRIIHNKKELRRYTGRRYFNLTEEDHQKLSEFWTKYPDGIMYWA